MLTGERHEETKVRKYFPSDSGHAVPDFIPEAQLSFEFGPCLLRRLGS